MKGLAMLKDYVEDGEVHSKLEFKGENNFSGFSYIGIKRDCAIGEISECMKEDFTKLGQQVSNDQENVVGNAFSIYHNWDMVGGKVSYTAGIPVKSIPSGLENGLKGGEIPATKVYTIGHKGPYQHLGNAWSTLYNMDRSKAFKKNKQVHPFEVYLNDPAEVSENELITEVNFAIK